MSAIGHSANKKCRQSDILLTKSTNVGYRTFSVEGFVEGYRPRLAFPIDSIEGKKGKNDFFFHEVVHLVKFGDPT